MLFGCTGVSPAETVPFSSRRPHRPFSPSPSVGRHSTHDQPTTTGRNQQLFSYYFFFFVFINFFLPPSTAPFLFCVVFLSSPLTGACVRRGVILCASRSCTTILLLSCMPTGVRKLLRHSRNISSSHCTSASSRTTETLFLCVPRVPSDQWLNRLCVCARELRRTSETGRKIPRKRDNDGDDDNCNTA